MKRTGSVLAWALSLLLALAGCGGGTDGDAPQQVRDVNAVVVAAEAAVPGYTADPSIGVYGSQGLFRIGQYQSFDDRHVAKLDLLTGPYAIGLRAVGDDTGEPRTQVSLAFGRGPINLNPLTTLTLAQVLGRDPSTWFSSLAATGDAALAELTPERLDAGQAALRRELARSLGVSLPDTLGDVFTATYAARAGDPMHEAILGVNAALAARGLDVHRYAATLALRAGLCNTERLTIAGDAVDDDFCPASKSAAPQEGDAGVTVYIFVADDGGRLTVRSRDTQVLDATLQPPGDVPAYGCTRSSCAGLVAGALQADGTRSLGFSGVTLRGSGGERRLEGSLSGAKPGPAFPTLGCPDRYQVAFPDGRILSACAAPDNAIGAGIGDASLVGGERRLYTFRSDGTIEPAAPALDVRADGSTLHTLFVQDVDAETGLPRRLYRCQGAACGGVTIEPARDDVDSFAPYTLRRRLMTIADATLSAFAPDGSALDEAPAIVRARLDSFEIVYPPEAPLSPPPEPCASPAQRLLATLPYLDAPVEVCPPTLEADPSYGYNIFLDSSVDAEGRTRLFIASGNAGNSPASGVTITLDGDQVAAVDFQELNGATFLCRGAACRGIVVGPPDAQGRRAVSITGATLTEVESAGLPGDRSAVIDGAFVAPTARSN